MKRYIREIITRLKEIITVQGFWANNRGGDYQFYEIIYYSEATSTFSGILTNILTNIDTNRLFLLFFPVFLFSHFCFFAPVQGYNEKNKLISLYVLCFYKWKEHINTIQNPLPTYSFKKYSTKTYPKITILKILVYKIQPKITEFKISGCILYTKISRIVTFGVVFKLYINIVLYTLPPKMFSWNFSQIFLKKNH